MKYGVELKELQLEILNVLKDVIRVCDVHEIEYFIIGGTALGAIRHGGFIPWDDDIDIGMTRKNYEKFLSVAKTELNNDLFLQVFETERNTPFYFAKIRKNGTKFIEFYCRNLNINQGVFIDIFPFDNIPDSKVKKKVQYIKTLILSNLFIAKTVKDLSEEDKSIRGKIKSNIRKIIHYMLKIIPKKLIYELLNRELQKYNNEDTLNIGHIKYPSLTIENSTLYPLKKIKFENLYLYAPNDCHSYLSSQYGDYSKLPPEESRHGHKPYILDF